MNTRIQFIKLGLFKKKMFAQKAFLKQKTRDTTTLFIQCFNGKIFPSGDLNFILLDIILDKRRVFEEGS